MEQNQNMLPNIKITFSHDLSNVPDQSQFQVFYLSEVLSSIRSVRLISNIIVLILIVMQQLNKTKEPKLKDQKVLISKCPR